VFVAIAYNINMNDQAIVLHASLCEIRLGDAVPVGIEGGVSLSSEGFMI
jgi:hypothetical protein